MAIETEGDEDNIILEAEAHIPGRHVASSIRV